MLPRLPGNHSLRSSVRCRFRLPCRHSHLGHSLILVVLRFEHTSNLERFEHPSCSHLGTSHLCGRLCPSGSYRDRLDAIQLPRGQCHHTLHRYRHRLFGNQHRHRQDFANRLSRRSSEPCNGWQAPRFGRRYRRIGFLGLILLHSN